MNHKPPVADPVDKVMKIPPVESPRHEEALLDQSVAETFPASDPIAPAVAARMEPADVQWNEVPSHRNAGLLETMRRNAPALVGIGTAAVALLVMRALRDARDQGVAGADAEYYDD
jgi:hypothetical protein